MVTLIVATAAALTATTFIASGIKFVINRTADLGPGRGRGWSG